MTRVMAQGTFDILHPGHLHYLRESLALGDELYVVIARDYRMKDRKDLYMDEDDRREMVDALEFIDHAVLGSNEDIFETVRQVDPDIITLGHDQQFEPDKMETQLAEAGLDGVRVTRITAYEGEGVVSSSKIKAKLRQREIGRAHV